MSKYIIDLRPDCKVVQQICATDKGISMGSRSIGLLDELTDDYVKENFKDLLEGEYQRGLEDGKWKSEDGCTGCEYEGKTGEHLPCEYCMNNFKNQWTAKSGKIEVGDEVNWLGDCFIVTRIFQPRNGKEQCDGIDDDGCVYHDILMDDLEKTGRHFDIEKILEEMRHD